MAITIRLKDFTQKTTPVNGDLIYMADSANNFNEVQVTVEDLIATLPGSPSEQEVQQAAFNYGADTGVADASVIAFSPAITSYTDGMPFLFTPAYTNATTTPTLNAGGGAKTIVLSNGPVQAGDLSPTMIAAGYFSSAADAFVLTTPAVS
ncbi:hypothetical protein UFOVP98_65 [uncultured Caudovirales phage]|uniref:Uncharacterized protein n=1 Tax=uncultured Caudovirales phage TaxID=2100421 RepID=A0A6J5LIS8_9CAUD|nr:hypothetical protein UFOVP98_65 [uncultured Caudovirales phage]CAB4134075.1 hypothetical protein UFOVP269_6 [uncultured Caudovirales phage]